MLGAARRREIAELRMISQGVVDQPFVTPVEVARHLVCQQGQHLGGVMAATAIRLSDGDALLAVREAFADGSIVRGYPMRGTIFLTAADDIAWMTAVTRERQLSDAAKRRHEHGFSDADIERAGELAKAALAEAPGGSLSRDGLSEALGRSGFALDGGQRYHLIYTLIIAGVLIYGPLHGSDHHLVDAAAWLPAGGSLHARFNGDLEAATTEWLRRYLAGHGPASVRDFHWWTKLPLTQLKRLAPVATAELESYGTDSLGEELWGTPGLRDRRVELKRSVGRGILLPPFDEVVLGYPDRGLIVDAVHLPRLVPGNNGVFRPTAHRQGKVVGVWRAVGAKKVLELDPFEPLSAAAEREFAAAYKKYPKASTGSADV